MKVINLNKNVIDNNDKRKFDTLYIIKHKFIYHYSTDGNVIYLSFVK